MMRHFFFGTALHRAVRIARVTGTLGILALAGLTPASAAPAPAPAPAPDLAQGWPAGPVHVVVSFTPGAGPDVATRLVADRLSASLGQPVVVDNRPGAGGQIAIGLVKQADADGLTLLAATNRFTLNPSLYKRVDYDPLKDFVPVMGTVSGVNLLVVNSGLGVHSVAELTQLLKDHPGKYNYASGGLGSVGNLSGELYKLQAGVQAVHVPFRGPAEAIKSVIAGETQFAFLTSAQAVPNVRSGRLLGLAVTGDTRLSALPDLPTMRQAGLPEFEVSSWQGIVAPAGTPQPVVEKLNRALAQAYRAPEVVASLERLGVTVVASSPQDFAGFLGKQLTKWTEVVKHTDIRLD